MSRRATAIFAVALYGLLGLLVGLGDYRELIRGPLARLAEFSLRPNGMLWVATLQGPARTLDAWALPLRALAVALLLAAFWLLASLLTQGFRLTKPADQQPGRGVTTHLDVPQLLRAGAGALLSLWVLGGLDFLATLASSRGRPSPLPHLLLGGLPIWTAPLPFVVGLAVHALVAALAVWWIWGPHGLVAKGKAVPRRDQFLCALLAGIALAPAILILHGGRAWLAQAAQAYSLSDRNGWSSLTTLAIVLPTVAAAYAAGVVALYRPRSLSRPTLLGLTGLAVAIVLGTSGLIALAKRETDRLDLEYTSLAARLKLRTSPLGRFALIFAPDGEIFTTSAPDGSANDQGEDLIACDGQSVDAVKQFLRDRNYRTVLAPRAYQHLVSCYSLDWLATRSMRASMEMLERAPSATALSLLLDKLFNCAITPDNRPFLLALTDANRFTPRDEDARRQLGFIARRFGDLERARKYLVKSELSDREARRIFGGVTPLTDGVLRGKMTVNGQAVNGVRLGLLRLERFPAMFGWKRAVDWRQVLELTHTNAKGEFTFRNIPQGRYLVAVTGGGVTPNIRRIRVVPPPGLLLLGRRKPRLQVPTFDLRFVRPAPGAPRQRPEQQPSQNPTSVISWQPPAEQR